LMQILDPVDHLGVSQQKPGSKPGSDGFARGFSP